MPERQTSEELQSHFEGQLEGAETPDSLLQQDDPYGRWPRSHFGMSSPPPAAEVPQHLRQARASVLRPALLDTSNAAEDSWLVASLEPIVLPNVRDARGVDISSPGILSMSPGGHSSAQGHFVLEQGYQQASAGTPEPTASPEAAAGLLQDSPSPSQKAMTASRGRVVKRAAAPSASSGSAAPQKSAKSGSHLASRGRRSAEVVSAATPEKPGSDGGSHQRRLSSASSLPAMTASRHTSDTGAHSHQVSDIGSRSNSDGSSTQPGLEVRDRQGSESAEKRGSEAGSEGSRDQARPRLTPRTRSASGGGTKAPPPWRNTVKVPDQPYQRGVLHDRPTGGPFERKGSDSSTARGRAYSEERAMCSQDSSDGQKHPWLKAGDRPGYSRRSRSRCVSRHQDRDAPALQTVTVHSVQQRESQIPAPGGAPPAELLEAGSRIPKPSRIPEPSQDLQLASPDDVELDGEGPSRLPRLGLGKVNGTAGRDTDDKDMKGAAGRDFPNFVPYGKTKGWAADERTLQGMSPVPKSESKKPKQGCCTACTIM